MLQRLFCVSLLVCLLSSGCAADTSPQPTATPKRGATQPVASAEIVTAQPSSTAAPTSTHTPQPSPIPNTPTPTPGSPIGTTDTGEILYLTTWDLFASLHALNLKNNVDAEIIQTGFEQSPQLSPDGAKVLLDLFLAGKRTLVIYDLRQGTYAVLPAVWADQIIAWSPDGNYAVGMTENGAELIDMRDGRSVLALWKDRPDLYWTQVSFASSNILIFNGAPQNPLLISSIELLSGNMGEIDRLADQAVKVAAPILNRHTLTLKRHTLISWLGVSPDGQRIALVGETPLPNTSPTGDDADLYVIGMDGKNLVNLTQGEATRGERRLIGNPVWSPDSRKLAYISCEVASDEYTLTAFKIAVILIDEEKTLEIDSSAYPVERFYLSWSADSQQIAYVSGLGIAVAALDQSQVKKLDLGSTTVSYAAFRPPLAKEAQPVNCARSFTHLQPGIQAVVAPGSANRVRSEPILGGNVIHMLAAGSKMKIVAGPVCADGLVFWKIESEAIPGGSGWTAEGDFKEYWLEPIP